MQLATLAPKQFNDSQTNRVRTSWRPRSKHSMRPVVRRRRTEQIKPQRSIELPENDQMREALNISKPHLKLRQDPKHAIRLVLGAKPPWNLARVLVRTTHKSNSTRRKHLRMSPPPKASESQKRQHSLAQHLSAGESASEANRVPPGRQTHAGLAGCPISRVLCEKWGFSIVVQSVSRGFEKQENHDPSFSTTRCDN
jgi:hypothetical protein